MTDAERLQRDREYQRERRATPELDASARARRARTSGAELGRTRILELLADGEIRGVVGLAEDALMSTRTCLQRLRELGDAVEVRPNGKCPLVRLRGAG